MKPQNATRRIPVWIFVVGGLLALLTMACVVVTILISRSPAVQNFAREAGGTIQELASLQAKVAKKVNVSLSQVGVRISDQVINSSKSGRRSTRTLQVLLENTPLNEMTDSDRGWTAKEIAELVRAEYKQIASIDQICVFTIEKQQVLAFSTSKTREHCFAAAAP